MKKYTLCDIPCSNEDSLKMIQTCLNIFLKHGNDSYEDKKQINELSFMVYELKHSIEIDRLKFIGINFY